MVMAWIVVAVLAVLFLVVGCGPSDSSKEKKRITDADAKRLAENMAAEQQLLADPSKATPQLMQRLRASVKMSDGLLMVESQSLARLLSPPFRNRYGFNSWRNHSIRFPTRNTMGGQLWDWPNDNLWQSNKW
jgi:hypothetical protein